MRIEPPPPQVATTRLADPGHGPAIVALLAAVFVATAAASSLLTGTSANPPSRDGSAARVDPGASAVAGGAGGAIRAIPATGTIPPPTEQPSLRPGEIACVPAGWRLAYSGSIGSWQVETLLVVAPVEASDPLDPRIPVAQLGHDVVAGLGACAPPVGSREDGRPARIERAWRVSRAGGSSVAVPISLRVLGGAPAAGATADARPDALALVSPAAEGAGWAAGQYVLEIAPPAPVQASSASGQPAWLGIQLEPPTP